MRIKRFFVVLAISATLFGAGEFGASALGGSSVAPQPVAPRVQTASAATASDTGSPAVTRRRRRFRRAFFRNPHPRRRQHSRRCVFHKRVRHCRRVRTS